MGLTHSVPPSPLRALIGDTTEEFHMASDGEEGSDLPSHRRNGARAPPALFTTTSLLENASTIHAMTTVPPWPDTDLPFEQ
jgi:hypothetical protein